MSAGRSTLKRSFAVSTMRGVYSDTPIKSGILSSGAPYWYVSSAYFAQM
jgi:hypothetical protein